MDKHVIRAYMAKVRELAAARRFGERDRLGTANLIDGDARLRGARAVVDGTVLGLARPLVPHTSPSGRPGVALTTYVEHHGKALAGMDHVELDCHGYRSTHLDALNHVGLDDSWYAGWPTEAADELSVAVPARHGLVTRAVVADIPALRGMDSVRADEPVTGDDLRRALDMVGLAIEPGDALLVYMGRDRHEAAGGYFPSDFASGEPVPGIGSQGAEWIADQPISMMAWDFQDVVHPAEPMLSVHWLIWAIGLLLVDNCDFSSAIPVLRELGRYEGLFVLSPLPLEGATGGNVNPLLVV
jgi:kynurenine formamidase